MSGPMLMAVVQPTTFCNLDCRYCYLPDRRSMKRLGLDTLARIARTLFDSPYVGATLDVLWHSGEPLVLPPDYYERAFAVLDAENHGHVALRHAIQTNATLIDERWCEFIRERRISVGVSVDGPAFLHDDSRVDRAGRGTSARTVRGMRLLREHGIPFHVIAVLTRRSLDHADAVWDFIVEEDIRYVGFNVEEIDGVHASSSLQCPDAFDACRRFFERLLALRERSGRKVFIRDVDPMLGLLTRGCGCRRTDATPLSLVSFDCDGNLSTFSPELLAMRDGEGGFVFGKAGEPLAEIVERPRFRAVRAAIEEGVDRCRTTCADFDLCGGGSPSNKLGEHGSFTATETMNCRLKIKAIASTLRDRLGKERFEVTIVRTPEERSTPSKEFVNS